MTSFLRADRSRPVALWLFGMAVLVLAMVVVGGATRLTDSGLSITQWKPLTGAIPPLSREDWEASFALYKQIPQAQFVNAAMTLEGYKVIFWWEWAHRFLGRLIGLAFAIPLVVFLIRRDIPKRLIWPCVGLLVLGGLQGLVGWWMVSSGLSERVSVAPERLAAHLSLALALFVALVWTALEAWSGQARLASVGPWRRWMLFLLAAVFFQAMLGALVAGNDAGFVYNDWPLMNGALAPDNYWSGGLWRTIAHNAGAVQLHHRIGAYLITIAAGVLVYKAWTSRILEADTKSLAYAAGGVVLIQVILGVVTLMAITPLWLALLHQVGAVALLAVCTALAWRVRRA